MSADFYLSERLPNEDDVRGGIHLIGIICYKNRFFHFKRIDLFPDSFP